MGVFECVWLWIGVFYSVCVCETVSLCVFLCVNVCLCVYVYGFVGVNTWRDVVVSML